MNLNNFKDNLKKIRSAKGFSASELSDKCNLRQKKRVSDIEEGRGKPSLEEVVKICDILDVKIDDMLNKKIYVTYYFDV